LGPAPHATVPVGAIPGSGAAIPGAALVVRMASARWASCKPTTLPARGAANQAAGAGRWPDLAPGEAPAPGPAAGGRLWPAGDSHAGRV